MSAWQQFDAAIRGLGIYNMGMVSYGCKPLQQVNPTYLMFCANQAQFSGVQKDYFSLIPFQQVSNDMSLGGFNNTIYTGADVQSTVASIIGNLQVYASGNFTSHVTRPNRVQLVNAGFFAQNNSRETAQVAASGAAIMGGIGMVNLAGGTGVLSGTIVGTAVELALAWTGVGLIVLGVGGLLYVGYRVFTQKNQIVVIPWYRDDSAPDPIYLQRIQNRIPPFYPPQLPPQPVPQI